MNDWSILTGGNSFACDFTYDSCGWVQDKSDNFDWTRKRGATTSVQTGPTGDHTTGSRKLKLAFTFNL